MKLFKVRTDEWTLYVGAPNRDVAIGFLLHTGLINEDEPRHIEELKANGRHYYVQCTKRERGSHIEFGSGVRAKPISFEDGIAKMTEPGLLAIGPIDCREG